ncbi:MAG: CcdB family protein [Pseudomonadota bacterium]
MHATRGEGPVLEIQSDLVGPVNTRLVIPLVPDDLLPPVSIDDGLLHAMVLGLTAIPRAALGPEIADAEESRDEVTRALDMVLSGA